MSLIDKNVLNRAVEGVNVQPGRFADQLLEGRTLLIFLRHFG